MNLAKFWNKKTGRPTKLGKKGELGGEEEDEEEETTILLTSRWGFFGSKNYIYVWPFFC